MLFEALGSMLLTFLYLTQTEEKTKLSGDPAITTMIIAATYTTVIGYSRGSGVMTVSPFNPAIAFGEFWISLFAGEFDKDNHTNTWIFLFFSFGGSILAVLLFEFVYKGAMSKVDNDENSSESGNEEE